MVESLYIAVATKYNIVTVLDSDNKNYYRLVDGKAICEEENPINEKFHEILLKLVDKNVWAFYFDTQHLDEIGNKKIFSLGIREELLPENLENIPILTEMIVLHELVHLIEQKRLSASIALDLSECDILLGKKIENHIKKTSDDLVHNTNFVAILHHLIVNRTLNDNPTHLLRLAMSKTLLDIEEAILNEECAEDFYQC